MSATRVSMLTWGQKLDREALAADGYDVVQFSIPSPRARRGERGASAGHARPLRTRLRRGFLALPGPTSSRSSASGCATSKICGAARIRARACAAVRHADRDRERAAPDAARARGVRRSGVRISVHARAGAACGDEPLSRRRGAARSAARTAVGGHARRRAAPGGAGRRRRRPGDRARRQRQDGRADRAGARAASPWSARRADPVHDLQPRRAHRDAGRLRSRRARRWRRGRFTASAGG